MRMFLHNIINHPTRTLLKMCDWVTERVNIDVFIAVCCVAGIIIVFWRW